MEWLGLAERGGAWAREQSLQMGEHAVQSMASIPIALTLEATRRGQAGKLLLVGSEFGF